MACAAIAGHNLGFDGVVGCLVADARYNNCLKLQNIVVCITTSGHRLIIIILLLTLLSGVGTC